ncbi:MAG TPA: hypothetical protein VK607_09020, partial [Kofleriaceae bacterium]|nr:hypothetical protein [Kofleriaceae bacterium]
MTDATPPTGTAEQEVINPPLPGNLNLVLNARGALTVATSSQVFGDVGASGPSGSVVFDVSSSQACCGFNVLASTVAVKINASVGHVFGNDITVDGTASQQSLGLNPAALPQVPAVTPAAPGTTNVSTSQNQAKQLCPGKYGAISLGVNSTVNLNGGVYQVTKLTLADGARIEPSEPVVILVSGAVTTGIGAAIRPSAQAINPMSAADVRLEIGGAITIGDGTQLRAHVLGAGKLTTGKNAILTGAAWAKTISIGVQNLIAGEGAFSAVAPSVPPPCNDNNACTVDACVGGGTAVGFCSNPAAPSGTSCDDGAICNGIALCDGAGTCQPGASPAAGTACPDGTVCNGDETCDGFGSCLPGTPPVVNDGNSCTTDVCDATTGVSHVALPDGTPCSGTGVCTAGTCSIQALALVGINSFGEFDRIDPDALSTTPVGPIGVPYAFGDCMFNPSDGKLYMVDGRGQAGLYTLDVATGAASLIGFHGIPAMEALAFHPPTNQVYALSYDVGALYSMSTTTGAATFIGSTPL